MTVIRTLAIAISERVARWAAPGCKDWAEGLAREVQFIESDWRALSWAIGSTRVLLDRRAVVRDPEGSRKRPPMWWVWPFVQVAQVLVNGKLAVRAATGQERIASSLIAFGWMLWTILTISGLLRERNEPPFSNIEARHRFTRANLEQRLERYRSLRRWIPLLIPISIGTGFVMNSGGQGGAGYLDDAFVIGVSVLAIWILCLDTPAKIQQRLDRLNDRIAHGESRGGR